MMHKNNHSKMETCSIFVKYFTLMISFLYRPPELGTLSYQLMLVQAMYCIILSDNYL